MPSRVDASGSPPLTSKVRTSFSSTFSNSLMMVMCSDSHLVFHFSISEQHFRSAFIKFSSLPLSFDAGNELGNALPAEGIFLASFCYFPAQIYLNYSSWIICCFSILFKKKVKSMFQMRVKSNIKCKTVPWCVRSMASRRMSKPTRNV